MLKRVGVGTATALLGLLVLVSGGGSARAVVDTPAPSAAGWEIRAAPFRLLYRDGTGKPTAEQIRERGRGPGSSMAYDLQDGSSHRLTNLRGSSPVLGGRKYVVGTDEPARTATVIVQRTSRGLRVALQPAAGVVRVYESFGARDGEHFLGAGQQGASVDLRGRALELKVSYGCNRTIVAPFYLSSAGYGVLFRTSAVGHLQFAGTHDGPSAHSASVARRPPARSPRSRTGSRRASRPALSPTRSTRAPLSRSSRPTRRPSAGRGFPRPRSSRWSSGVTRSRAVRSCWTTPNGCAGPGSRSGG